MTPAAYAKLRAQWRAYLSANRFTEADCPFTLWFQTEYAYAKQIKRA